MPFSKNGDPAYETVNRAWKSTCRIIFGEVLGELADYAPWLYEFVAKPKYVKSSVSAKDVYLGTDDYSDISNFKAFDEIDFNERFEPLSINQIKDIEGILEAIDERMSFAGNVVLGNSSFVNKSCNITDSHYVYASKFVSDSKYVGICEELRYCENIFGFYTASELDHVIKGTEAYRLKRSFECHAVYSSSDCYFCSRLENCHDCFFCFGSRNRSYSVGNVE